MPRYEIRTEEAHGTTAYHLIDNDRRAEAVIYPALGNNCTHFRTTPDPNATVGGDAGKEPVDVFMPPDNIEDLRTHSPFHGGNPILFPFPNRVRQGVYTFEGATYHMDKLLATGWDKGAGQAIHGLVGDKAWTVMEHSARDNEVTLRSVLSLTAQPDIMEQYPFPGMVQVRYTLRDGLLEMETKVQNEGVKNMPMGFGIHPWFPSRLRPGAHLPDALKEITTEQRAGAEVHVPADAVWELDKLMPTGKVVSVNEAGTQFDLQDFAPLKDYFFDHVFTGVQRRADGWSEGGLRDPETGLEMYIAADAQFREWVLYAPLTSPVIALEPYTCTTDAVNLQARGVDAGLISLASGETWTGVIRFGLRRFA